MAKSKPKKKFSSRTKTKLNSPARSDVYVSLFSIAWLPYRRVSVGGREVEIPAF